MHIFLKADLPGGVRYYKIMAVDRKRNVRQAVRKVLCRLAG